MSDDPVYKIIELTGTSKTTLEDAIQNALTKAGQTVRNLRWFHVSEIRGAVAGTTVSAWQVTVKIGFAVED
jgi:dodecin